MKFTVPQKHLASALATAANAASSKATTMPVLGYTLFTATMAGNLLITATDLELSYATAVGNLEWETPQLRDLTFLMPAKKIAECVKAIPGSDVKFSFNPENLRLTISGGTVTFTLAGLDPVDFPALPVVNGQQFDLDAAALVQIIGAVAYAQSKDTDKWNLCGINLKVEANHEDELFLTASATDGHRLALDTVPLPGDPREVPADLAKGIIISSRGVAALGKIASTGIIVLSIAGNQLLVTTPEEKLYLRLVDGSFPDVDRVIPKNLPGSVEVKRQALTDALERCRILADGKSRRTRLGFGEGGIAVSSQHVEFGQAADQVTAAMTSAAGITEIHLNADYLLDALDVLQCGVVNLQLGADMSPMLVTPLGTDWPMAVIMPQRM